jgi:hypothetical protein
VLGAEVGVSDDPVRRRSWAARVQHADEVAGAIEIGEPRSGVGVLGGDQACDRRRIDGVQLPQEPPQPPRAAGRRAPAE